jgi:Trk-type K+ transport system membrane component
MGAFNAVSAFNNSGMSLLDANMVPFNTSIYMLITMSLLILAGNTCFPIFLRLIVWTLHKLMPDNTQWKDARNTLKFLLDHPRRCYTNIFPSEHTWWLLLSVVILNGIDCAAFAILNVCIAEEVLFLCPNPYINTDRQQSHRVPLARHRIP